MLRQFRAGRGFGEAFNNVGTDSGALAAVGSGAASLLGFASNWVRIAQLVEIVRYAAFPLMGYLLAILYVAFPLVLAAGILPGGVGRLVTYFALVASVKAWPLAWAVVDQVYGHLLPALWPLLDRGWSAGNLIIDKPPAALNLVTGLMYVIGPDDADDRLRHRGPHARPGPVLVHDLPPADEDRRDRLTPHGPSGSSDPTLSTLLGRLDCWHRHRDTRSTRQHRAGDPGHVAGLRGRGRCTRGRLRRQTTPRRWRLKTTAGGRVSVQGPMWRSGRPRGSRSYLWTTLRADELPTGWWRVRHRAEQRAAQEPAPLTQPPPPAHHRAGEA